MGAIVAAIGIVVRWALVPSLGAPLATIVAVAAMVLTTGAFHEDGFADAADGLWGGRTPEERLRIMRDSRLGTYGTVALLVLFAVKFAALAPMTGEAFAATIVPAMVLARASSLVMMRAVPPATDSLATLAGPPSPAGWAIAGLTCVLSLVGFGVWAWAPLAAAALVTAGSISIVRRKVGGVNGDQLGAANQLVEIAVLSRASSCSSTADELGRGARPGIRPCAAGRPRRPLLAGTARSRDASSSPDGTCSSPAIVSRRSQVLARVVVTADRRVEPLALRQRLVGQVAERQVDAQVPAELLDQRDRAGREGATDVVRHLRVEAHRRDARAGDRHLEHGQGRGRHAQQPLRTLFHVVVQEPRLRRGAEHVHGAGVRHGRRDGAQAHPLHDAEAHRGFHHLFGELLPPEVGLGPVQHEQVAFAVLSAIERDRGPVEAA